MNFDAWVAKVDELSGGKPIATKELLEAHDAGLSPERFVAGALQSGGPRKRLWIVTMCDVLSVLCVVAAIVSSVAGARIQVENAMFRSAYSSKDLWWEHLASTLGVGLQTIAFGVVIFALGRYIDAHPQWFNFGTSREDGKR